MSTSKIAIIVSHPIQYNSPFFKFLQNQSCFDLKVFYTWGKTSIEKKFDPGFGENISWDIPLLEGYNYEFLVNKSKNPGSHHFFGIDNPDILKKVNDFNPDYILLYGWAFKSHLKCLRYFKKKKKIIFRGDSTLIDEKNNLQKIFRRFFLTWVYSHVDYALYTGENNRRYFLKHGLKETQLFYGPHCIDNDRFQVNLDQNRKIAYEWRQRLGITDNDFVLLFVGKLEEKKRPALIINLLNQLNDKRFKIIFVGSGELESKLRREVNKNIFFLGFQNQSVMPVIYQLGNVFILPSKGPGETWGLAANEAMASGLPIVLSEKVGGAMDLIYNNGIIFQNEDIKTISNYILRLANDDFFYSQNKSASLANISKFTFEKSLQELRKIIFQIDTKFQN